MTYRNPVIPGFHPDPSVCRVGERVLPGDLVLRLLPRRPHLPVVESGGLDADRQRPRPPVAARLDGDPGLVIARHLCARRIRSSRRAVLDDHDKRQLTRRVRRFSSPARTRRARGPIRSRCRSPASIPTWPGTPTGTAGCTSRVWAASPVARVDMATGELLERTRTHMVGHRPAVPRVTAPLRAGRDLVPPHRRGRDARRHCISVARGPVTGRAMGGTRRPTPSSVTAAPIRRFRTPGTATWSRPRTGAGGWSCSACAPEGSSPGFHTLGRETFLIPVQWVDGWPVPDDPPAWRWRPRHPVRPNVAGLQHAGALRRASAAGALGRRPTSARCAELADGPPGLAHAARWRGDAGRAGADVRRAGASSTTIAGPGPASRRVGRGRRS